MEIKSPTRADTLAWIARRLRDLFGTELVRLFVLRADPYEPEGMDFDYTLVAVTAEDQAEQLHEAATAMAETLFPKTLFIYALPHQRFEAGAVRTARVAREEGIEL